MANNIGGNVWELTDVNADVPVKPGITWVNSITWQGYGNPNDRAVLVDDYGAHIFECIGDIYYKPQYQFFAEPIPVHGLRVAALDSGYFTVGIV